MTKIVLTRYGGSDNRGCEAILRGTVDIINRYIGQTEITLLSSNPSCDRSVLLPEFGNIQIPDTKPRHPRKYSASWVPEVVERRILRPIWPGIPSYSSLGDRAFYRKADLVISVGGDVFTDDYSGPSRAFGDLFLARQCGSLTVIWGATIGPFKDKKLEKKWANKFRKVNLITVRESMSLEYLKSIGVTDNVIRVADPAFLLPARSEGAASLPSAESDRTVGIGMSAIVSGYGFSYDKYIETFAAFGKKLLSHGNTQLLLIPHVVQKGNDDEVVCQQLAAKLPHDGRVKVVDKNNNACQMKHIIAQCDYFIGARTHSTIASLSSGVPTITIGYSRKAYGINKDLFDHVDYVLPVADLDETTLEGKYAMLCENRGKVVETLSRQLPLMKSMANQGGESLKALLQ